MKTELNLKCRELILHRQQTTQAVYLASVTSRRSRRRSEFTVAPPTRTRYSHTQARDNVVLRIRQQAERTAAIAGRIVHIGAHTSESERKNWARKKRGRERKPTKVRVYRLMCIRDRAQETRRYPEAAGERPAELWTHSGFLRVVPAGWSVRGKGQSALLNWVT